jgi:hypothetical protein
MLQGDEARFRFSLKTFNTFLAKLE